MRSFTLSRACTAKLHLKVLDDGGIGCRIAIFQEQASARLVVEVVTLNAALRDG